MTNYERGWQECAAAIFNETVLRINAARRSGLPGDIQDICLLELVQQDIRKLKLDGGKSLAELEGDAFQRGRDESDGEWNEKVATPLRTRIAELLTLCELMACGHPKACLGQPADGRPLQSDYCSACQHEKELVEECAEIQQRCAVYADTKVAGLGDRLRTICLADGTNPTDRAKLGVNRG